MLYSGTRLVPTLSLYICIFSMGGPRANRNTFVTIENVNKSQSTKVLYRKERMLSQSNLVSAEGRLLFRSLCRSDELD